MSETETIASVGAPITRPFLVRSLNTLGLQRGDQVLLHASLSKLGWTIGGAQTAIEAVLDVLGPEGTLIVPTQTSGNSDPSHWEAPAVPEKWWAAVRQHMPAFDPAKTPSRQMGAVAEMARTWPGALRSSHPQVSFAAIGQDAHALMATQALEDPFGNASPLARAYDGGAKVILLGVGFDRCTCFHLAEVRSERISMQQDASAILENGKRVWRDYQHPHFDNTDFAACGEAFAKAGHCMTGKVGAANATLFALRDAVDFADHWFRANRPKS